MNPTPEMIEAILRRHVKVDATGLSPAVASAFIVGIEDASREIAALDLLPGEPVAWRARHSEQESWYLHYAPVSWWECQSLFAAPAQQPVIVKALDVDALAQEIRRVDGNHALGAGALAEAILPFVRSALSSPVEGGTDNEADIDTCPVCSEPLNDDDLCSTDIELGVCHAACLEGSPTVNLDTGEQVDGPIPTYRYGDLASPPTSAEIEALRVENAALRKIISDCAASLPNGAFIGTACSVEFMQKLPKEISLVFAALQQEPSR